MRSEMLWTCWVLYLLSQGASAAHPRALSMVKPGLWAGSLQFRLGSKVPRRGTAGISKEEQRTTAVSIGEYVMTVNMSGILISGVIDTGSGIPQVACTGAQAASGFALQAYNVSQTWPQVALVAPLTSPDCQMFCNFSDQCLDTPVEPGACEYQISYGDDSYAVGRVYSGVLTLPPSLTSGDWSSAPPPPPSSPQLADASFCFGSPPSLWSQLISAGAVSDTMYLCLGDGGDGTGSDQSGLIILGTDDSVGLPANYSSPEVVTADLMDPSLQPSVTYIPTMWLLLTDLSIGASPDGSYPGSGSLMGFEGESSQFYLLDSGTSNLYLTPYEYAAFAKAFHGAMYAEPQATYIYGEYGAFEVTLSTYFTAAELDGKLPPILFTFQGSSGPMTLLPSQYMIFQRGTTYNVNIAASTHMNVGILGNAFLNGWLVQQTRSTLQLKMTRVQSCNDVLY